MIRSFNRRQRIGAVLSLFLGIVAYLLAFGFFYEFSSIKGRLRASS